MVVKDEYAEMVTTVREAAAELHCSISFVYKLMKAGELGFERRGRRKLPLTRSVISYRQRNLVPPVIPPAATAPVCHGRYTHLFRKRTS
jgi:excisionase family DNA binding protein